MTSAHRIADHHAQQFLGVRRGAAIWGQRHRPRGAMVHQYLATFGDTYWVQRLTSTTPTAGKVVTINDTAPTSERFNLSLCNVLPVQ